MQKQAAVFGAVLVIALGIIGLVYRAGGDALPSFALPASFTKPCDPAITYTVGEIDPRYGITREQLVARLAEAAALWNVAAGSSVLAYAEDGDVRVNLVFSEHQEAALLNKDIASEQAAYADQKASIDVVTAQYDRARNAYEALVSRYEADQESYNRDVAYWNARGGAPAPEYAALEKRRHALETEQRSIEQSRRALNALADEVQQAIDTFNALVEGTNAKVATYNQTAGGDFDQGRYVSDADGKRITINEFMNAAELKRVLAHELGHALGLDHVENAESIMYPYDLSASFALTPEDTAELKRACGLK